MTSRLRIDRCEEIAASPPGCPRRGQALEPVEDVPDVNALLDHPVARALAAGEPAVVAVDRAVAAGPARPGLDERAQFAPTDQLDPLAKARVRTALKADVDDQVASGRRRRDQPVTAFERDRKRLLGVKVLPSGNYIGMNMIVGVARKRDQHGIDVVAFEQFARVVERVRAPAPCLLDDSFAALAVLSLSSRKRPRPRYRGSRARFATGPSRDCRFRSRPAEPDEIRRPTAAASARFPCESARLAAAEQLKNRRRLSWIRRHRDNPDRNEPISLISGMRIEALF